MLQLNIIISIGVAIGEGTALKSFQITFIGYSSSLLEAQI